MALILLRLPDETFKGGRFNITQISLYFMPAEKYGLEE